MAVRWSCPQCGLPMMHKDTEIGLISACPRCRHETVVPEASPNQGHHESEKKPDAELTLGEKIFVHASVWGIVLLGVALAAGIVWLMNFNFSAPDQMIKDGIGTFGSEHLKKP